MNGANAQQAWLRTLEEALPVFGHRNWIVVADSAYPAQSSPGIETVAANAEQLDVLRTVLRLLDASKHVRGIFHTDDELALITEEDAPGASAHREALDTLLAGRERATAPHEQIIAKLDEAARRFRVLVIKTRLYTPFTSVFIELGCGYSLPKQDRG